MFWDLMEQKAEKAGWRNVCFRHLLPEHPVFGDHNIGSQAKVSDSVGQDNTLELF